MTATPQPTSQQQPPAPFKPNLPPNLNQQWKQKAAAADKRRGPAR